MTSPRRTFRPPWWATLGTLALGGLFLAAGGWQLSRAAEKRAIFAAFEAGAAGEPAPLPGPGADLAPLRYRTVRVAGRYDAARQVLLDARTRAGRAGYEVLTPLVPEAGPAILVNRGWVPADPDRTRLPDVAVDGGPRSVAGLLDRLPRAALGTAAPAADPAAPWPRRLLFPTAAALGAELGYDVADLQVLLDPAAPDGYDRAWRPALLTPEQHVGYAVQWFALAAALVVLYAALNWRRPAAGPPNA